MCRHVGRSASYTRKHCWASRCSEEKGANRSGKILFLVDSVRLLVVPLATASLKVLLGREYGSRLKLTVDNERARNFLNFTRAHMLCARFA